MATLGFLGAALRIVKSKIKNKTYFLKEIWQLRQNPDYFYVLRHMNHVRVSYILDIIAKFKEKKFQ